MIFLDRPKRFALLYVGKGGGLTKDLLILSWYGLRINHDLFGSIQEIRLNICRQRGVI